MNRVRLDIRCVETGLAESREKARALIMAGEVFVDGQRRQKPGEPVPTDCVPELRGAPLPYVSRGGLKLEKALRCFPLEPAGLTCLDCGASTGGFTDVLLQNGAKKVYAVDVGYGQLAWRLRSDGRVVNLERTNARTLSRAEVPESIDLAVMDMSFISLKLVLPAVRELLRPDGDVVCLVKPQFEAGREKVGKKGVVRDKSTHIQVLRDILLCSGELGFTPMGLDYSPLKGPEGNIEYLLWLKEGKHNAPPPDVESTVARSHSELDQTHGKKSGDSLSQSL